MTPAAPLLITESTGTMTLVAAVAFLVAGAVILLLTLRSTLYLTKAKLEDEVRRWQAQSDYWRTIEKAVEKLSETVAAIDRDAGDRQETLAKLCEEAKAAIQKLNDRIEEAHRLQATPPKAKSRRAARSPETDTVPDGGRIVQFDRARAALHQTHRRVGELFDQGHTVQEISKETGIQMGEIDLILSIRNRSNAGSA